MRLHPRSSSAEPDPDQASTGSLTFGLRPNPDKQTAFVEALVGAGHQVRPGPAELLLTDVPIPTGPYGALLDRCRRAVVYPHGPGPLLFSDGIWPEHPAVAVSFVIGTGSVETMRRWGHRGELVSVGWPYGQRRPFRPTPGRRVLFAATHPDGFGHLSRPARLLNRSAADLLAELDVELIVRHVGSLRANGLQRRSGVTYHRVGDNAPSVEDDIDAADVVVAAGTLAYTAVARGAPTVFFGQSVWLPDWFHAGQDLYPRSRPALGSLWHYPHELLSDDPAAVLARAAAGDDEIVEWRERFIGADFDPRAFVDQVKEHVS